MSSGGSGGVIRPAVDEACNHGPVDSRALLPSYIACTGVREAGLPDATSTCWSRRSGVRVCTSPSSCSGSADPVSGSRDGSPVRRGRDARNCASDRGDRSGARPGKAHSRSPKRPCAPKLPAVRSETGHSRRAIRKQSTASKGRARADRYWLDPSCSLSSRSGRSLWHPSEGEARGCRGGRLSSVPSVVGGNARG